MEKAKDGEKERGNEVPSWSLCRLNCPLQSGHEHSSLSPSQQCSASRPAKPSQPSSYFLPSCSHSHVGICEGGWGNEKLEKRKKKNGRKGEKSASPLTHSLLCLLGICSIAPYSALPTRHPIVWQIRYMCRVRDGQSEGGHSGLVSNMAAILYCSDCLPDGGASVDSQGQPLQTLASPLLLGVKATGIYVHDMLMLS